MSILFCTPCYGGNVTTHFLKSALDLENVLTRNGLDHDWLFRYNESLVHRARNGLASDFLKTDYSAMMFIDADIQFTPEDVAKLWNLDTGVAVGVYPMKKLGAPYAAWVDGSLVTDLDQYEAPIDVDYAGTGFMLIKREVLESLGAEEYEGPNGLEQDFFPTRVVEINGKKILESEDYGFCRHWRAKGGKIVMDPSVRLVHHGQHAFGGEHAD